MTWAQMQALHLDKSLLYSEIAGTAHGMMEDTVTRKHSQKMTPQNLKLNHITTYLYLMLSKRCNMGTGKPTF